MSLLNEVLLGEQVPQIVHLPPDVHSLDAATEVIELADAYGVADGWPLDESQKFTIRAACGLRADGSWAASTVADFEPRQNGKNDALAAREIAGLILWDEQLIIHTAHEFPTANEAFLRIVSVFENWDALRSKVARIRYANGEQGIELLTGQRLKYRARTGGSGRGFAKADLVVYDEAQHLQSEHVAASGPTKLANRNSQAWYLGSGGLSTSVNAWALRKRALSGNGGRLAYVEHTAEEVSLDASGKVKSTRPDVYDRSGWARANAAYGYRITEEKMFDVLGELGPDLFARECECIWDPLPDMGSGGPIDMARWAELFDPDSAPVGSWSVAIDVGPDLRWSSVVAAGRRSDSKLHVEVLARRPGTDWVLEFARLNLGEAKAFRIASTGPGGFLIPLFAEAGIPVEAVSAGDVTAACSMLIGAVAEGTIRHRGGNELPAAISNATIGLRGDSQAWSRVKSSGDISALVAATIAVGGVPESAVVDLLTQAF